MIRTYEQKMILKFSKEHTDMPKEDILKAVMEAIKYNEPLTDEELAEREEYVRELLYNYQTP